MDRLKILAAVLPFLVWGLLGCSDERPLRGGSLAGQVGQRLDAPPVVTDQKPVVIPEARGEKVLELTFTQLASFRYRAPDPYAEEPEGTEEERLPAEIRRLHGQRVSVEGYMVPLRTRGSKVETFVLSRFIGGCCFGRMPRMNEGVEIALEAGETVEYVPHGVILVTGRLEVGEVKDEYGYVTSVYRMKAESVE